MARADFNVIPINHVFTSNSPNFQIDFRVKVEGNREIVDDGYLLVQVQGVQQNQVIRINGDLIAGVALAPAPGNSQAWRLGMGRIEPGTLNVGSNNTIRIERSPGDNFHVTWVVVHWREQPA